jgi:hypothetical protein
MACHVEVLCYLQQWLFCSDSILESGTLLSLFIDQNVSSETKVEGHRMLVIRC